MDTRGAAVSAQLSSGYGPWIPWLIPRPDPAVMQEAKVNGLKEAIEGITQTVQALRAKKAAGVQEVSVRVVHTGAAGSWRWVGGLHAGGRGMHAPGRKLCLL